MTAFFRIICSFAFGLLAAPGAFSQTNSLVFRDDFVATGLVEDGPFVWASHYGGVARVHRQTGQIEHFLPTNGLDGALFDGIWRHPNGSIWAADRRGMKIRVFENGAWQPFLVPDSLLLQQNKLLGLDKTGAFWLVQSDPFSIDSPSKICRFSGQNWQCFSTDADLGFLAGEPLEAVRPDGSGGFWASNSGKKLLHFSPTGVLLQQFDTTNSPIFSLGKQLVDVFPMPNGAIFVQTTKLVSSTPPIAQKTGLYFFDGSAWLDLSPKILETEGVSDFFDLPDGSVWIAQRSILHFFEVGGLVSFSKTNQSDFPTNPIRVVLQDSSGQIWLGAEEQKASDATLFRFDGQKWEGHSLANSGLKSYEIQSVFASSDRRVWAPTQNGLSVLRGFSNWEKLDIPGFGPSQHVNEVRESPSGQIFAFEHHGGAANGWNLARELSDGTWAEVPGAGAEGIYDLEFSEFGFLWVLTSAELRLWNGINWEDFPAPAGQNFAYDDMTLDENWNVFVATGDRILKFGDGVWETFDSSNSALPPMGIERVFADFSNQIWVTTNLTGQIFRFDGSVWEKFDAADGVPNVWLGEMQEDQFGRFWIASRPGLVRFDGQNWVYFNGPNSALDNDWTMGLALDECGNKWMANFENGLSVFNEEGLQLCLVDTKTPENALFDLKIQPNPSAGLFEIRLENAPTEPLEVQVFDARGMLKRSKKASGPSVIFDLEGEASGLYFFVLEKNGQPIRTMRALKID